MKRIFVVFLILVSTTVFAQEGELLPIVKKDSNQFKNEIGWNFRNTAAFLLGGQLFQPQFNLHYKRVNNKGNAMRYNLNLYRENPFFPGTNGNIVEINSTRKVEVNVQRESTMALLGVGWEYRAPTEKKAQFYIGGDILAGYKLERRITNQTTYLQKPDSILLPGSQNIYVTQYEFESIEGVEETTRQSIMVGVRANAGVIWKPSERFWLTTSLESSLLQGIGTSVNRDFVKNMESRSTQTSLEYNNRLIADFSLYYRF